jgi:tRNA pseudouridine38-40 synthase
MRRYFIELAYKGTNFKGFQIQPNVKTVEGELEKAISILLKKEIDITGSSRTDTGVHAMQQFVHFDFEVSLEVDQLAYRLNKILDFDILIKRVFEVSINHHARFDAIARRYEYRIETKKNPFSRDFTYQFFNKIDVVQMNNVAQLLLQHDDFQCFSKVNTQVNHFRCNIITAHWSVVDTALVFTIEADRFLRGMVRAIVGTLLEVGLGSLDQEGFQAILDAKNRSNAGRAVPAEGLFLMEVKYPKSMI